MRTFVSTFSLQTERLSPHHKTKEQMLQHTICARSNDVIKRTHMVRCSVSR